jgi:hypothetical protein
MPIRILEDVGAPLAVTAVDILTEEMAPDWNEWGSYILTGVGYLGGLFLGGKYSPFLTNLGVASLPLTARHIYERVKGAPATRRAPAARMALRANGPVSSGISRSYNPEFAKVSPYAF